MKIKTIHEDTPDFQKAIATLITKLTNQGYQLVTHTWEEGSGNRYEGYFLARHPQKLETYKLRDFQTPDAYHIARSYLPDDNNDTPQYTIMPQYQDIYKQLKDKYPDLDEILQLDGEIVLPDEPEAENILRQHNIPYEAQNGYLYLEIVEENEIDDQTLPITTEEFLDQLDAYDLPIVAKRLYQIYEGQSPRWQEYRLDNKSDQPLIDWDKFNKLLNPDN